MIMSNVTLTLHSTYDLGTAKISLTMGTLNLSWSFPSPPEILDLDAKIQILFITLCLTSPSRVGQSTP